MRLSPDRVSGFGRRQTQNADAYDAYLRGRYIESRRTAASNARAIEEYKRAIAIDPDYALAWSSLSFIYAGAPSTATPGLATWDRSPGTRRRARYAPIPTCRSAVQRRLRELAARLGLGRRREGLPPRGSPRSQQRRGNIERWVTRSRNRDSRQKQRSRCVARASSSPLEPINFALSSQASFQGRDYPAAIEHARRAVFMDSQFWIGHVQLAPGVRADRGRSISRWNRSGTPRGSRAATARRPRSPATCSRKPGGPPKPRRSSGSSKPTHASDTCRPMRWRSCMPASAIAMRCLPGSTKPTPSVTCISSICPSTSNGIRTGLIPGSSDSSPVVASRREAEPAAFSEDCRTPRGRYRSRRPCRPADPRPPWRIAGCRARRPAPSSTGSSSGCRPRSTCAATAGAPAALGVVVMEIVSASTSVSPSTAPDTSRPGSPNARPAASTANSTS